MILIVGVAGFEPTTSTSQMWRDTGLRYTPNWYLSIALIATGCKDIKKTYGYKLFKSCLILNYPTQNVSGGYLLGINHLPCPLFCISFKNIFTSLTLACCKHICFTGNCIKTIAMIGILYFALQLKTSLQSIWHMKFAIAAR